MSEMNTLFLKTNWGLERIDESGIFESRMWNLNEQESEMKYLSLHKTKADRAYRGGEIIEIRDATDDEVSKHQSLMEENNRDEMSLTNDRKIIVFRMLKGWKEIWPKEPKKNPMAYKGLGHVSESKHS